MEADRFWRDLIEGFNALRDRGMSIVLIAHSGHRPLRRSAVGVLFALRHPPAQAGAGADPGRGRRVLFINQDVKTKEEDPASNKQAGAPRAAPSG